MSSIMAMAHPNTTVVMIDQPLKFPWPEIKRSFSLFAFQWGRAPLFPQLVRAPQRLSCCRWWQEGPVTHMPWKAAKGAANFPRECERRRGKHQSRGAGRSRHEWAGLRPFNGSVALGRCVVATAPTLRSQSSVNDNERILMQSGRFWL